MKSGFARLKITPKNGIAISGYYEIRSVKGVLDDLFVSAVSFDDGERRAVIVAVDTLMLSAEQCNHARELVSERTGLDKDAIIINCSHTHTGPIIGSKLFTNQSGDPEYDAFFYDSIAEAAKEAFKDMKEAKLYTAESEAKRIAFVRRYRMKDGRVATNPGVNNPDIDHVLGRSNDTVKLLSVEREDGERYAIVNFGMHSDTVGGELVSGDWPAALRSTVERALDNTKCIFLLGSEGDINHVNTAPTEGERRGLEFDTFDGVPRGYGYTRYIGRRIAGAVIGMIDSAEPLPSGKIRYASLPITIPSNQDNSRLEEAKRIVELYRAGRAHELPYENMELTTVVAEANRIVGLENGPMEYSFTLGALALGDYVIAGLPGECFAEIGRRIEAVRGGKNTMVTCLTNGGDSYFPTSEAYDEGGYEAMTSRLRRGGDEIIVEGMTRLFGNLK
jgi:hypothetical protein